MISDKAKAAILDKCCQKVDCLARGEVIDLEGAADLPQSSSPVTASARDAFEAWATSDSRAIQPLQFEERTDYNNHYYESDHDNNAFIGWKAAGLAQTPAEPEIAAIHQALIAANLPYAAYSSDGINLVGDSKSIKAAMSAFHSHGQIDQLKTQIRHWRDECGKLHGKLLAVSVSSTDRQVNEIAARSPDVPKATIRKLPKAAACDNCANTGWCHANDKCYLRGVSLSPPTGESK
jgi:hypothetical protein